MGLVRRDDLSGDTTTLPEKTQLGLVQWRTRSNFRVLTKGDNFIEPSISPRIMWTNETRAFEGGSVSASKSQLPATFQKQPNTVSLRFMLHWIEWHGNIISILLSKTLHCSTIAVLSGTTEAETQYNKTELAGAERSVTALAQRPVMLRAASCYALGSRLPKIVVAISSELCVTSVAALSLSLM